MWLINQDERKKFISATIEEMATPFLDKSKRPDSFYWESLFEFEIPIKILTEISTGNAAHIIEKYVDNISFTRSPYNNYCWKDDSKRIFSSISHLEKHYYINRTCDDMVEFA